MSFAFTNLIAAVGLFVGVIVLLHVGQWLGARKHAKAPGQVSGGAIEASVFGLLGLLLAFTFNGAAQRFDTRRSLVVDESNAIGTAYLRLSALPEDAQAALRDEFRRYLDLRIETYRALPDLAAARHAWTRSQDVKQEIWTHAVEGAMRQGGHAAIPMLVLPALNVMFDLAETRRMAAEMHPPPVIFAMLFAFALVAALLAGYASATGASLGRAHAIAFAIVMSCAVYVIIDIEFPRMGLIRVDSFDHTLVDLRASMR